MFVGLFLTYDIITCRMISDFIFRSISYLPVGQSTVSPNVCLEISETSFGGVKCTHRERISGQENYLSKQTLLSKKWKCYGYLSKPISLNEEV